MIAKCGIFIHNFGSNKVTLNSVFLYGFSLRFKTLLFLLLCLSD
jgi:hypothetical protein